jgi:hypothetical protein
VVVRGSVEDDGEEAEREMEVDQHGTKRNKVEREDERSAGARECLSSGFGRGWVSSTMRGRLDMQETRKSKQTRVWALEGFMVR